MALGLPVRRVRAGPGRPRRSEGNNRIVNRLIERVAEAAARHRTVVLIAAGLITALAAWGGAHLPIRTSRKALFPEDEPVQRRLDSFIEKFGAASDLMVVLEGAPRPTLEAFATALTERLRGLPTVLDASARLDTDFLFSHLYLMIPPETLQPLERLLDRALAAPPPAWSETVTLGSALASPSSAGSRNRRRCPSRTSD